MERAVAGVGEGGRGKTRGERKRDEYGGQCNLLFWLRTTLGEAMSQSPSEIPRPLPACTDTLTLFLTVHQVCE